MLKSFFKKFTEPKYLLEIAVVALIYFITAKFGLSLSYSIKQVSLIWPPTGISLAVLVIFGPELWPGIALGAYFANLTSMETASIALGITFGNTLEALVGAYALNFFGFHKSFGRVKDVVMFILFAAGISTMVSATIGTISLIIGGIGSWDRFPQIWQNWWIGDLLGDMIIAPALLVWSRVFKFKFDFLSILEGLILFSFVALSSVAIFTGTFRVIPYALQNQFKYLIFPLLIWAAYRFKQKGSTLAVLVIIGIAVWGAITGSGPFIVSGNPEQTLQFLGVFAVAISLTFMIFSVIIEERDNAEETLSASERKFRNLIENSADAILMVDTSGIISYASESVKRVLGYTSDELIKTNGFKLVYDEDVKITRDTLESIVKNPGKTFSVQNRLILKNGKVHWMEAEGTNLYNDPDINAIIINFRDINERKQLDQVKTEFVSLSAHQLRSPLAVIRWYTETLIKAKDFPKNLKSYLMEVYSATLAMNDTVNLLLDVSRFELGTVQITGTEVELPKIILDVVNSHESAALSKAIKISDTTKEKIPEIIGDAKLIRVIIDNLVSNAIKYTPEAGKIEVNLVPQANNILFKIKDSGIGIPVEDQPKIFTKLFRGSNVKKVEPSGLGLGLYLIKLIVDLKGGKIWFESEEGKGTTFFVEFPKEVKMKSK